MIEAFSKDDVVDVNEREFSSSLSRVLSTHSTIALDRRGLDTGFPRGIGSLTLAAVSHTRESHAPQHNMF
jgi:hypothetical protein